MIEIECNNCGNIVRRYKSEIKKSGLTFCDKKCYGQFNSKRISTLCLYCGKEIIKRKNQFNRHEGRVFCGYSCSAKYTRLRVKLEYDKAQVTKTCLNCNKDFTRNISVERKIIGDKSFCNNVCYKAYIYNRSRLKVTIVSCLNCGKVLEYTKRRRSFCGKSCSSTYKIRHTKKEGTQVSKFEKYIQKELVKIYPEINFKFNRKDDINGELDVYLPDYKLAFEFNGIVHYEPIYGEQKLSQTQNNDERKFQACLELGIELAVIDISPIKYMKEDRLLLYLEIITDIINSKIKKPISNTM